MTPQVWRLGSLGAAAFALCVLLTVTWVKIGFDVFALINRPQTAVETSTSGPPEPWSAPKPLLRANNSAETLIGEVLNVRLSRLGYSNATVRAGPLRPLGGGLYLTEVRIEGRGDAETAANVANWVAINRNAVRMKSLSLGVDSQNKGALTILLEIVVA
jgi:hypothetical protein